MQGKEKLFENKVKKYLDNKNIYYFKYFGNAYSTAGIPDLTICCNGRYIGVELKTEKGKTTPLQDYNIKKIIDNGGIAMILRPNEFDDFKKMIEEIQNDKIV